MGDEPIFPGKWPHNKSADVTKQTKTKDVLTDQLLSDVMLHLNHKQNKELGHVGDLVERLSWMHGLLGS